MFQRPQELAVPRTDGREDETAVRAVPALDRLAALVGKLLRVPVALVSLVEETRQQFPGMYGTLPAPFDQRQTPISHSFCQHVAATGEPLVIQDARLDERVACNPAVRDLNVISYLGMPLTISSGQVLGSLCAIDSVPRGWTEDEQNTLRELVGFALTELEAHHNEQRLREAEQALTAKTDSERDRLIEAFRRSPSFIVVLRGPQHVYEFANDRYCQLVGRPAQDIL